MLCDIESSYSDGVGMASSLFLTKNEIDSEWWTSLFSYIYLKEYFIGIAYWSKETRLHI